MSYDRSIGFPVTYLKDKLTKTNGKYFKFYFKFITARISQQAKQEDHRVNE